MSTTTLSIGKMNCQSCVKLVTMAIKSAGGTPISVTIGSATFEGNREKVKAAIQEAGYIIS